MVLFNYIFNVLWFGAIYSLVAIGFTLIFGVGGILNFAHGAEITIAAFTTYTLIYDYGIPLVLSSVGAIIITMVFSICLYLIFVKNMDNLISIMIVTFLVGFSFEQGIRIFVSESTVSVRRFFDGNIELLDQTLAYNTLFIIASSWIVVISVFLFINYSKLGKALIAMSNSQKGAKLVGISGKRINLLTWALAGALAAIAGVLIISFQGGNWNMGLENLILAFSIVVLGGLGSIKGSIVGAYLIAFFEIFTIMFIDSRLLGFSALIVLLLVLLIRPTGLYGRKTLHNI